MRDLVETVRQVQLHAWSLCVGSGAFGNPLLRVAHLLLGWLEQPFTCRLADIRACGWRCARLHCGCSLRSCGRWVTTAPWGYNSSLRAMPVAQNEARVFDE